MDAQNASRRPLGRNPIALISAFTIGLVGGAVLTLVIQEIARGEPAPIDSGRPRDLSPGERGEGAPSRGSNRIQPRQPLDSSGYSLVASNLRPWPPDATLTQVADTWRDEADRHLGVIDGLLAREGIGEMERVGLIVSRSLVLNYKGQPLESYENLERMRSGLDGGSELGARALSTIIYLQGVAGLRLGENENCIMCRGESSCILPISPAAVHVNPRGSRLAIRHFTEYLEQFPDDLEVRWLLNLAHMTLGEHPEKVDPRYLIPLDRFRDSEFDLGRFRDVGHVVGVNRLNQAGGAVMEDFDGDGLLDLAVTSFDALQPMSYYRNAGDGTFEDRSGPAGVTGQLGGLVCYQADYDNDGRMDLFIPRGAWLSQAVRPSLLRNEGDGTFSDATPKAGLMDPVNSNSASWADYDNDGWIDLFIACENQPNRLYHSRGDGTFEQVAERAGVAGASDRFAKGSTWVDYNNDGYPDLFVNNLAGTARLYRNNRDGTFRDVTRAAGIDGPENGFSCWAWDYDNDGWLDLFATCYDRTLDDVVRGLIGQPHARKSNRLFRNLEGKGFEDKTTEAGLDLVFSAMGSNFADFDDDGFLDFYLGTGEPSIATLIPNRMFKNVGGRRFAEITGSSGTGNLQKGHGVACGDWDRDGDVDLFVQMGGAIDGDKYHNILFQNPGQGNHWLTVKLVGQKTNRAAIGARIKVVTAGPEPLTVHRHVSSGSSFGANPLEQTFGLAGSNRVAMLEVHWPTSGTTQVFRDLPADQAIEVTEFAESYKSLERRPIPIPE
jgi:hypothetical protein